MNENGIALSFFFCLFLFFILEEEKKFEGRALNRFFRSLATNFHFEVLK